MDLHRARLGGQRNGEVRDSVPGALGKKEGGLPVVRMNTNRGTIEIELFG